MSDQLIENGSNKPVLEEDLNKDIKPEEHTEEKDREVPKSEQEGIFSKVGHVIKSMYDKTVDILMPDMGPKEETEEKQEKKSDDKSKENNEQKMQKSDENPKEQEKFEQKEKPTKLPGETFDDKSKENLNLTELENKSKEILSQQKKQETHVPAAETKTHEKDEPKRENVDLDKEIDRNRTLLEYLNINKDSEKENKPISEPEHNKNYFQDISKTLQFGEEKASSELEQPESRSQEIQ
jgi:hypothetical protein